MQESCQIKNGIYMIGSEWKEAKSAKKVPGNEGMDQTLVMYCD
jgi:hypothetical protein